MQQTQWRKSSFSGNGPDNNCVELTTNNGAVHLRESETPNVIITTTPHALATLIHGLKNGLQP